MNKFNSKGIDWIFKIMTIDFTLRLQQVDDMPSVGWLSAILRDRLGNVTSIDKA